MNTADFKEFYNKLNHELLRFNFNNRLLNTYIFKREDKFFSIDFNHLLDVKIYTKLFNNEGVPYDLNYLYNSSYRLTTSQNMKVKKLIESFIWKFYFSRWIMLYNFYHDLGFKAFISYNKIEALKVTFDFIGLLFDLM